MLLQKYLEESAAKWGHKIAVKFKNEYIEYCRLDAFANQIANSLLSLGVQRGDTVGIYLSKSIEALAAIFGVLKAGAVYVPLDSDSPVERTSYIISNCKIKTIVVDDIRLQKLGKNKADFPQNWSVLNVSSERTIVCEEPFTWQVLNRKEIEKQPESIPEIESQSENDLAYILYTSGSTGQPKGVMLTHLNGTSYVEWAASCLGLGSDDVFSSHAPFHFDLSIFDVFVSLKVGGTLCLIPPGISYFPDAVLSFICNNKITVWYSVPSALIQLLSLNDDLKSKLSSIRTLIYAGEVFPYPYLNKFGKMLTDTVIYNFYGPTETNVITCYKFIINGNEELTENVPIGKPCEYANILIVDKDGQPVTQGTVGELIANGQSLMKGYWGDQQKTDKAIRRVSVEGREELFYFTGDMVVQREDGNIVYVNRRDNMVKTRGFRVELGEIESVLYKHPAVYKAAVVAIPDPKISHRLISFIALQKEATLSHDDLDKHCSRLLPAYMMPEKVVFLPELPLTANGKIDREKLKSTYTHY